MKIRVCMMVTVIAAASLGWSALAAAAPKVQRVDSETLLLTDFSGKPPFRRQYIDQQANPELYAHYAQRVDLRAQPLMAVESRGAPGKIRPRLLQRISSDALEIAEFARFEETDDAGAANNNARRWSGAPGKGRRAR